MRIRKMTATFGCLDGAVLELTEGVNTLVLPNEGGKSTWAAFLTAMFYGLDPRRGARGRLPDKERYAPWSGKPMEGQLELVLEGRTLILQRTSSHGRPFGDFKVWDKVTGLEVHSITAENCGIALLGVEREVFCRSAFLSGAELAVTPHGDLSRRLGALAAAGRETDSFLQADERLKGWQNRLQYHRMGELPKAQQELERLEAIASQEMPQTADLPPQEQLQKLLGRLQSLQGEEQPCPPALEGVPREELTNKAHRDLSLRRWSIAGFAALTLLLVVFGLFWKNWLLALSPLPLVALAWSLQSNRLPRRYGVERTAQVLPAVMRWSDELKRRWELALVIEEVCGFAPGADTTDAAEIALLQALACHRKAEQLREAAPEPEKLEQLREKVAELQRRQQAILLARQALAYGNSVLQRTYVPQLTRLAGQYLEQLTLGRYEALVMGEDLEVSVRERDGLVRPLAALSAGTQDQTWLALRLAMTQLLLPPDAPVVLDDALLTFDQKRQAAAMEVLAQQQRQVIVFSCR